MKKQNILMSIKLMSKQDRANELMSIKLMNFNRIYRPKYSYCL